MYIIEPLKGIMIHYYYCSVKVFVCLRNGSDPWMLNNWNKLVMEEKALKEGEWNASLYVTFCILHAHDYCEKKKKKELQKWGIGMTSTESSYECAHPTINNLKPFDWSIPNCQIKYWYCSSAALSWKWNSTTELIVHKTMNTINKIIIIKSKMNKNKQKNKFQKYIIKQNKN